LILCIADVVPAGLIETARGALAEARFVDGAETAGWHARLVKHNQQAARGNSALEDVRARLTAAVLGHDLVRAAALPRTMRPLTFSRYAVGMGYGNHVDDAIMAGDPPLRSDISVTLFLAAPEDYDGGELVLDSHGGEDSYKLPAGHVVIYPSTALHRVAPVTRGTRDVAIGWIQSLVRDAAKREILFDLDTTRRSIFGTQGKSADFDRLSRSYSNLLRLWSEI
jgi:PKHD-type hydroxylase